MAELQILRSIDIENTIRLALTDYFTIYNRPLPENFVTPSLLVQMVGGSDANKIDTFDVSLDSRAKVEEDAMNLLLDAIGALRTIANESTTALRHVAVNSIGSWGNDPARPDLCMCTARLRVTAHQEIETITKS